MMLSNLPARRTSEQITLSPASRLTRSQAMARRALIVLGVILATIGVLLWLATAQ
jgi:hypothetical protein